MGSRLEHVVYLGGEALDFIKPSMLLAKLLEWMVSWGQYSPLPVFQENYKFCCDLVAAYCKILLKEKEYYVGQRGWTMAKRFLIRYRKLRPRIKKLTKEQLLQVSWDAVLASHGVPILRIGAGEERVYIAPKNVEIPALTRTCLRSRKRRRRIFFDDPYESLKHRVKLIFESDEERLRAWVLKMEWFFNGFEMEERNEVWLSRMETFYGGGKGDGKREAEESTTD